MNKRAVLLCVSAYLFTLVTATQAQTVVLDSDDDNEASEFVAPHAQDQRRASRLPAPPQDYEARAAPVIDTFNVSENIAVRQQIRAETDSAASNRRAQSAVVIQSGRAQRTFQLNTNMNNAVGEPVRAPRLLAMPWPNGHQCEIASLRYKFKKNRVWVYPPLPNDVGTAEAANQAIIACTCAKTLQNLPCYNGSAKIATGNAELIMP